MWFWAGVLRPLKHLVPLPRLVALVRPRAASHAGRVETVRQLDAYMRQRSGPRFHRVPHNCLERSLAGYRLLLRAGASPSVVIGIRPGASGIDGHVWVVLDGRPFGEDAAALEGFTRVASFDADGHRESGRSDAQLKGVRWA